MLKENAVMDLRGEKRPIVSGHFLTPLLPEDFMRLAVPFVLAAAFAAQSAAAQAPAAGDPVKGKTEFGVCAMCHANVAGKTGIGPSLFGVVGRQAGTVPGFNYSAAMKTAGAWTPDKLDAFIASPKTAVPGTSMPFGGIKDAGKRADIVAYLGALK
jgi:cytochrome c